MTVKEMGGRSSPRVAAPSSSGGGFLVKLKVSPLLPATAATQINRLLALSFRCHGLKYRPAMTDRAWRRLLDPPTHQEPLRQRREAKRCG